TLFRSRRPSLRVRPLSARFPPVPKRRCLRRLRSFRNGFLRRMLHGNEDVELVLLAGNLGHLFLVAIAVGLIVKTIGSIGPDKLDDFSLPRGDRRLLILRRIEPLFEITAARRIETNDVQHSLSDMRLGRQWQTWPGEGHIHDLDTEELAIERLAVDLDGKLDWLCALDLFFEQGAAFAKIVG